jgi:hypothetical protein
LREDVPLPEKLLQTLHNLCATAPELARRSEELAQVFQLNVEDIENILNNYEAQGYTKSFIDDEGKKRYYLTGTGIIKVCSIFT